MGFGQWCRHKWFEPPMKEHSARVYINTECLCYFRILQVLVGFYITSATEYKSKTRLQGRRVQFHFRSNITEEFLLKSFSLAALTQAKVSSPSVATIVEDVYCLEGKPYPVKFEIRVDRKRTQCRVISTQINKVLR